MQRTAPARRWELRPLFISQARSPAPACAQPCLGRHYAMCAGAESASPTVHPMKKALILSMLVLAATANAQSKRLAFEGTQAIHKLLLKDLGPDFASDWSAFQYLVLEIRTSTPQRFHLIVQDKTGVRRLGFQPFGQNVWFRAAVPLKFFMRRDLSGFDMASANNRPWHSFWLSIWGPFGPIRNVQALAFMMDYPLRSELR